MTVRLGTKADAPAIIALYQASVLPGVYGPLNALKPLFFDADSVVVVNTTATGVNACILARADRTTNPPAVCILFIIATSLTAVRAVLRQVAVVAQSRGFGSIYGVINQKAAAVATTRTYLEARFPYVDTDPGDSPEHRVMSASVADIIAKA